MAEAPWPVVFTDLNRHHICDVCIWYTANVSLRTTGLYEQDECDRCYTIDKKYGGASDGATR